MNTFSEVIEHVETCLKEATQTRTGAEDVEELRSKIFLNIADRWLKVAELMNDNKVLEERKQEVERNHALAEKLGAQAAFLNLGEGPDTEPSKGTYR